MRIQLRYSYEFIDGNGHLKLPLEAKTIFKSLMA